MRLLAVHQGSAAGRNRPGGAAWYAHFGVTAYDDKQFPVRVLVDIAVAAGRDHTPHCPEREIPSCFVLGPSPDRDAEFLRKLCRFTGENLHLSSNREVRFCYIISVRARKSNKKIVRP
jgi:hypothetical protein